MVVSGAPDRTKYHALHICDMALDMVSAMSGLRDPSSKGNMKIRVGKFVNKNTVNILNSHATYFSRLFRKIFKRK